MATKTTGIKFEFTGDASKAVESFKQLAQAGKGAGGDLARAGTQIEKALAAAEKSANRPSLKSGIFSQLKQGLAGGIDAKAGSVGLGGLADELGGGEAAVGALSSKLALAAGATAALGAVAVGVAKVSASAYLSNVEAVDKLNDAIGGSVEQSDKLVATFRGVGVSADTGSSAMAKLAKNVTTNQAQLERYGVIIAHNASGGVDLAGTLLNVATAYQAQTDPANKAQVANAAFGKSWTEMVDVLETSRTRLAQLGDQNKLGIRPEDLQALKEYKAATAELGATKQRAEVQFGRPVVEKFTQEIQVATAAAGSLGMLFHGDLSAAWDNLRIKSSAATVDLGDVATSFALAGQAGAIAAGHFAGAANQIALASVQASNASAGFAKVLDSQNTGASAAIKFRDAIGGLAKVQTSGTDTAAKYATATEDGAKAIADAEESAARRVVDAQQNVEKARLAASRAAEDATMRVADAQQALVDAATGSAGDNPLDRDRKIGDARKALDRAQIEASRSKADAADNVKSAEDDLTRAQVDGAKAIADAQDRATKSQQAATAATDAATVSVGSMTGKVDDLVKSTMDMAFQTAQAGGSTADVKAKVDEAKAALDLYGPAMGLTAAQVEYYRKQLDLIPPFVGTKVRIDFSTVTSGAQGMALAGINAVIVKALTDQLQIPQFAGGGTFRSSSGSGLAVLHDGEKVLTPDQQSGGVTVNVYGSVMSDRDLADTIQRAVRRGVQGIR